MATKKQNRRYVVRKVRRALNRYPETLTQASGERLNYHGWGSGISAGGLRMRASEEDGAD
jgi:hypothetical protein